MQQISLIVVGKPAGFYADGVAEYQKRLQRLCRLEVTELAEEPIDEKNASPAQVAAALEKEGARILAALPKGATLAALCVEGKPLSTEAFAGWLEQQATYGGGAVAFAIGSSHGLAPAVKEKAAKRLSLSGMTLPHQLARLVLTEQIYRAFMMRAGARYHK